MRIPGLEDRGYFPRGGDWATLPSIGAAPVPEGLRGAFQSTTGDHPDRQPQKSYSLPPLTGPNYYRRSPANVVMADGRHESWAEVSTIRVGRLRPRAWASYPGDALALRRSFPQTGD